MTAPVDAAAPPASEGGRLEDEVRTWLAANWDPAAPVRDWWRRLARSGWGFPTWPTGWYGRDLPADANHVVRAAMDDMGVLGPPWSLAQRLGAPMLFRHGRQDQKHRLVRAIAVGQEAWCEMFSEPEAGSDLASLRTTARRDGDRWVVEGQKLWTSGAQYANRAMLLARTDPDLPKHRGLSMFLMNVDQPGITIRPIRTMNGHAHFNEVFLDQAVVRAEDMVGPRGGGWGIAMDTLSLERFPRGWGGGLPGAKAGLLDMAAGPAIARSRELAEPPLYADDTYPRLAELAVRLGCGADPVIRQGLAQLYVLNRVQEWTVTRARVQGGAAPGSHGKLARAAIMRLASRVGSSIAQAAATTPGVLGDSGAWLEGVITTSPGESIAGGTSEIQRNVIAERVLGLPRDRA